MPFPIPSREDVLSAFAEADVPAIFVESNPTDVLSDCKYHTIIEDIEVGYYPLESFISAQKVISEKEKNFTFGSVRLLATQTFHREKESSIHEHRQAWEDGLMV